MSATAQDLQQRVEDIRAKQPPVSNLDELADRVDNAVREALRIPAFDAARAAANEAGLNHAKAALGQSVDRLDELQAAYREAQAAERRAKDAYDAALVEAEWTLDGKVVKEGTKTFVCVDEDKRQVTAAEASAWKKAEASKLSAVKDAAGGLRAAEAHRQEAADAVGLEERRFTACRLELEASIAQLSALTTALGRTA